MTAAFGDNLGGEGWDAGVGYLARPWRVVIPLVFVIGLLVRGWRGVAVWVLLFCH